MTVRGDDVHVHVGRILADESGLLGELEGLLSKETDILRGDDVAAIERIGFTRHRCVDALARLEAERADVCRMLSYGVGRAAFEQLLTWCDRAQTLRQRWLANLEAARRCKEINDRNGALVSAKLVRVQKLLTAIRGTAPPPVYSARGSRHGALGRRDFGCA
jgi:flagellar biosynthesis/type III secretory pathway chaperone